ncbi:MAG: sugar ABC transporter permease [Candidatus Margulisbacteria bacterium]|nr:sugar ABC transporter permease [Candidatus Margulisiibacteriota bacterium]
MKKQSDKTFKYYFRKYRIAYLFIAPTLLGMILMHLVPIVQGIYMSFLKLDNFTLSQYLGAPFVMFKNYYEVILNADSPMRIGIIESIRNTIIYTVFVTVGQIGLGMIVALMLHQDFKGRSFARTLFMFSWIVPTYVTGILWGFMWQQSIGIINIIFYDFFKIHIICQKINIIIHLLKFDAIIGLFNDFVVWDNQIMFTIINSKSMILKLISLLIVSFIVVKLFEYLNKRISKRLSYLFLVVFLFVEFMALINVQIPTLIPTTYKPFWLVGPNTIWAIIIPTIWRFWPLSMLMLLAGLQSISTELYDAVKIDGANRWQAFWSVTWPMLRPVWMILILFGLIYNVYSFNIVIMMFGNGAGFPGEWGDLMMTNIFRNSFMRWDFGTGAATSVLLLMVMIVAVNIWFRFYKKSEEVF